MAIESDLTLANNSQACCKSAEKVCADSKKPENFSQSRCVPAHALSLTKGARSSRHLKILIKRFQMIRRLAASLQKKFAPILKRQETFASHGAYMRFPLPRVLEVQDA